MSNQRGESGRKSSAILDDTLARIRKHNVGLLHDQDGEKRLEGDWKPPTNRAVRFVRRQKIEAVTNPVRDHDTGNDHGSGCNNELATLFRFGTLGLPGGYCCRIISTC